MKKIIIIALTSNRVSIGSCSRMVCSTLNEICNVRNGVRRNGIQLCHVDVVRWKIVKNRNRKTPPTTTTHLDYWDNSNQFPVFGHVTSDITYNGPNEINSNDFCCHTPSSPFVANKCTFALTIPEEANLYEERQLSELI